MIIDAMDILYSGNVDGYCIVSSDSDFTRLAARLRESGMLVLGMERRRRRSRLFPHATSLNIWIFSIATSRRKRRRKIWLLQQKLKNSGNSSKQSSSGSRKNKDLKRVRKAINAIIEKFF